MFDVHALIAQTGIAETRRRATTKADQACVDAAVAVLSDEASAQDLVYAGPLAVALPHKSIDRTEQPWLWRQKVGSVSYAFQSGTYSDGTLIGVPFGSKARMILIYLQNAALRNQSAVVDVGASLYDFMHMMTARNIGGMTYKVIIEQARRIGACRLGITQESQTRRIRRSGAFVNTFIQTKGGAPDSRSVRPRYQQQPLESAFPNQVVLDKVFYDNVQADPISIRLSALRHLSNNSLSIDIYLWLSRLLPRLEEPLTFSWARLVTGFGARYRQPRHVKQSFLKALPLSLAVYPAAKVEVTPTAIVLHPSAPPIEATLISGPKQSLAEPERD
jgi:hypothetical protein